MYIQVYASMGGKMNEVFDSQDVERFGDEDEWRELMLETWVPEWERKVQVAAEVQMMEMGWLERMR